MGAMSDTRHLVLVRHAEAATGERAVGDHERALTRQGRDDAVRLGDRLARLSIPIGAAYCSSALRARETWAALATKWSGLPEPAYLRSVYQAGPRDLLALVSETADDARGVVLVAHNPAVAQALAELDEAAPGRFPAGAAAVLTAQGPWSALRDTELVEFLGPTDP